MLGMWFEPSCRKKPRRAPLDGFLSGGKRYCRHKLTAAAILMLAQIPQGCGVYGLPFILSPIDGNRDNSPTRLTSVRLLPLSQELWMSVSAWTQVHMIGAPIQRFLIGALKRQLPGPATYLDLGKVKRREAERLAAPRTRERVWGRNGIGKGRVQQRIEN